MKANATPVASLSPMELETLTLAPAPVESVLAELPFVQAIEPQAVNPAPATVATVQVPAKPLTPGLAAPASAWTMFGSLLLVLGLILLLARGVRALQGVRGASGETLKLRGSLQVGSRERVVWMQAGETHLLLGVAAGRVNNLHVFEVPPDFDQPQLKGANSADFAAKLRQVLDRARQRSAAGLAPTPGVATAAAAPSAPPASVAAATSPQPQPQAPRTSRFHTSA